ncbi:MAG TPA: RDD family protein [Bryobacteraceae bacterium]
MRGTYPVSKDATARVHELDASAQPSKAAPRETGKAGQQALFQNPNPSRLVAFESLTSPEERESIRARAASQEAGKRAKVEVRRARPARGSAGQQRLDFFGQEEILTPPQSNIICDAPVAPIALRVEAALIDGLITLLPAIAGLALFLYEGGHLSFSKQVLPFWMAAFLTVPVLYKLLWTIAGRDSIGMSFAGLRLVDFDGHPPSSERRYQRMFGSFLSVLAAGTGLIWALVDEDALTWHDHISGTFPTLSTDS